MRASRGAGYSWGLCEEAAFAATFLHERGFVGLAALYDLLTLKVADNLASPDLNAKGWRDIKKPLSSLEVGVFLSDFRTMPSFDGCSIAAPLLILPFLAQISTQFPVFVKWHNAEIRLRPSEITASGQGVYAKVVNDFTVVGNVAKTGQVSEILSISHPVIPWAGLRALEQKTFVPETEHSRRFGAGDTKDDI